ncbi:MAG TPA: indolepyruvate oxidoreductase subunit beta family protein [Alphaproteobacteria bacterium]|nr:indolepyruvate oxidoreductase subunit beta family protein [Alphaproteobacteria bacterium]
MTALPERPVTILIAALGGEGGGVLADWLVDAANAEGFPVQSTSIPGVAQRTGATTYYVEIFPARADTLDGRQPVMALTPNPGNIDLMVASELIEAGRAMQNGYVSPDRTTLVASTHRIYAIAEKVAMTDGRFDSTAVTRAADELAKWPVLRDFARVAQETGSVINAVLFGAIAATGALPFGREACEAAIRRSGKGIEGSLRGFAAGFSSARGDMPAPPAADAARALEPVEIVRQTFPPATHAIIEEGVRRLTDYQDAAYARTYLEWLAPILAADRHGPGSDYKLTNETARHLALWMSYEDVIRVADLKTRASRHARVRAEVGAKPHEPVAVVEFLKPGVEEFCAVLPSGLGRRIMAVARHFGVADRLNVGLHIKTTTITGFLILRTMARLKPWRRRSWRFAEEQHRIRHWLDAIQRHAHRDIAAAVEIAACAKLLKGYGETHWRGRRNFDRIFVLLIDRPHADAAAIRRAREAALADPEGDALDKALAQLQSSLREGGPETRPSAEKKIQSRGQPEAGPRIAVGS